MENENKLKGEKIRKKIKEFLTAKWWVGVVGMVAIITLLFNIYFWNVEKFFMEEYVVNSGQVLTVETQKIQAHHVVFGDSVRIVVPPQFREWEINANILEIGRKVEIVALGSEGQKGEQGGQGANAREDCQNGHDGIAGYTGKPGGDAPNVKITVRQIILKDQLKIGNSGGNGGKGGDGGRGGDGGKADRSQRCRGGDGGKGGNGGKGGDGGNGGEAKIIFTEAFKAGESGTEEINRLDLATLFHYTNDGGLPGEGGTEGYGGNGGAGREGAFGIGSQPPGNPGRVGTKGDPGEKGKPGTRLDIEKKESNLYGIIIEILTAQWWQGVVGILTIITFIMLIQDKKRRRMGDKRRAF